MKPFFNYLTIIIFLLCYGCSSDKSTEENNSALNRFIVSPSVISRADNISIQLRNDANFTENFREFIDISPSVKGEWVLASEKEIVFSPENYFTSGSVLQIEIQPKALKNIEVESEPAILSISVLKQDFDISLQPLRNNNNSENPMVSLSGLIQTADLADFSQVKKMITADVDALIEWSSETNTRFSFTLNKLPRNESAYSITLDFSGNPIDVERSLSKEVTIPSLSDFSISSVSVINKNPAYISVNFTDNIVANQDFSGVFSVDGVNNIRPVVNGNEVRLFYDEKVNGSKLLTINPGLENTFGYKLSQTITRSVAFDAAKPELRNAASGTILPSSEQLVMPFEAIGLQSVYVTVIKIYEDNLPVFFQVNQIDDDSQTKRVGDVIFEGNISLMDQNANLNEWSKFHLDLSKFFNAEKGALYRIIIGMRPGDAAFPCESSIDPSENTSANTSWSLYDSDDFDSYGSYSNYYYPPGYEWQERDNPCHVSYYTSNRSISSNLLASDIGLIAKVGADQNIDVFTTSIISGVPVETNIKIIDYQLQELAVGKTDKNGMFRAQVEKRPFLVIAEQEGQKSYLKLNDGRSLSTSNFDVTGQQVDKNLKGFIYGERGVWRPGDQLFLSLMLKDPDNTIPQNYPVRFELRDPDGNLVAEKVNKNGLNKVYTFQPSTDSEARTGNWQVNARVGNTNFSKSVKIEAIKPNRLKIDLDFDQKMYRASTGSISGKINARWLTGITAEGLKAEIKLNGNPIKTVFDGFPNYSFEDNGAEFNYDERTILDRALDNSGNLNFSFQPGIKNAPGAVSLRLDAKVFEPGGNYSIYSQSIKYLPYSSFVGVRSPEAGEYGFLKRNKKHQFDVARVSDNGKPLSGKVRVSVYKIRWRWWWDQQNDYDANYITRQDNQPVYQKSMDLQNGKGSINLDGNSMEWGRHVILVEDLSSGHVASEIFYLGWSENEKGGLGATFLSITSNKDNYQVGDEVQVNLPQSVQGRALVAIENGSSVLDKFWIETSREASSFSFKATEEMAPNIYLNVTLIQPHANKENDLPIRLYGILPLKVYNPGTVLEPAITISDELGPGQKVNFSVSENSGSSMTYTVAIVDEGLLDITGYNTPEPWNHFYQKEAIGVKTWDIYDDVMGAFGGQLERLLAVGGGGEINAEEEKPSENRFDPVVIYLGPYQLKDGQTKEHSFTMPQYVGSVKTMLVASNKEKGAYGNSEAVSKVIQPLMILGTMPRVVGPGEKVRVPVNVFRYKENISNASLSIETTDLFTIEGNSKSSVTFNSDSELSYFNLNTRETLGDGKITLIANSGSNTARHDISITSRAPNPLQTDVVTKKIDAGNRISENINLIGIEGTNELELTISTLPPINLNKRLDYLINYPHGCIEQVTSSVFPQLFLKDISELTTEQQVKVERNIKAGIERIAKFQTYDGGMSYWPGYSDANHWGTNYAFHFLIESQKSGYYVNSELMDKLVKYQKTQAKGWSKAGKRYNDDVIQAYRLFTLALSGNSDLSSMNRMRNLDGLSREAIERLAAAYALDERNEVANQLLEKAGTSSYANSSYWYSYGSDTRNLAMRLESLLLLDKRNDAFSLLSELSKILSSDQWLSTQTTAYSLLAASKFIRTAESATSIDADINWAGESFSVSGDNHILNRTLATSNKQGTLAITNNSGGEVYATITTTGLPLPGKETANAKGMSLQVTYLDENGNSVDPVNMNLGDNIDVVVKVTNTSGVTLRDLAVTHIFPSGWEINNQRLTSGFENPDFDFQDIRDDRVYTYFDLSAGSSKTVNNKITVAYQGRFYLPSVKVETMYDGSKYARSEGKWIEISE